MPDASFEGWVVVELLGHRVLSGYARTVPLLGTEALRLDVALPEGNDPHTEFFFAHSIYGIVLSSQEAAQARAGLNLGALREAELRPWAPTPMQDEEAVPGVTTWPIRLGDGRIVDISVID